VSGYSVELLQGNQGRNVLIYRDRRYTSVIFLTETLSFTTIILDASNENEDKQLDQLELRNLSFTHPISLIQI
jgi:hypothetical protein